MQREPNTEYVLSLSYGKDSLACLGAIEELGWPLDRITHAEVWATDDIPADLPPMVQFKAKADEIIRERYGIEVEHQCAVRNGEKLTYEKLFYHIPVRKKKTLDRFGEGGGCWFCHNQGIDQLRILRKEYPDLWKLLMKWDRDSPVSFHADGHTVHDFDLRFQAEDLDLVPKDRKFRWKMLTGDTMVAVTKEIF